MGSLLPILLLEVLGFYLAFGLVYRFGPFTRVVTKFEVTINNEQARAASRAGRVMINAAIILFWPLWLFAL